MTPGVGDVHRALALASLPAMTFARSQTSRSLSSPKIALMGDKGCRTAAAAIPIWLVLPGDRKAHCEPPDRGVGASFDSAIVRKPFVTANTGT